MATITNKQNIRTGTLNRSHSSTETSTLQLYILPEFPRTQHRSSMQPNSQLSEENSYIYGMDSFTIVIALPIGILAWFPRNAAF